MTLDYKAIDVDNHYYESLDSCTRHLPKEFKRRGVQMVADGKRTLAVMGEVVNHIIDRCDHPRLMELYYWTQEPGLLEIIRAIAAMPDSGREALESFFRLGGDPQEGLSEG